MKSGSKVKNIFIFTLLLLIFGERVDILVGRDNNGQGISTREENDMILRSRRVWIGGQFVEAQLEIREGKIQGISPYGSRGADEDYEIGRAHV